MMEAMSDGVILEQKLAGDRRVGVERNQSGPIELLIAERANRGGRGGAIAVEKLQRSPLRDSGVLLGVTGVHVVDHLVRDAGYRLTGRDRLRQLDLDRIDARDMVHDDADSAPVVWDWRIPLGFGEIVRQGSKGASALFETIGKRVSTMVHCCLRLDVVG